MRLSRFIVAAEGVEEEKGQDFPAGARVRHAESGSTFPGDPLAEYLDAHGARSAEKFFGERLNHSAVGPQPKT